MIDIQPIVFWVFSSILVVSALAVVSAKNAVHSALFLVLAFFSCAAIWMLLEAEFLALLLILVYVGAVMVLFLFVVMMLDINVTAKEEGFIQYLPFGISIGVAILAQMVLVYLTKTFQITAPMADAATAVGASNSKALGTLIYTEYLFQFEVAALILLVAIVAAIALTLRKRKNTKFQSVHKQVMVKKEDRLKLVDVKAKKGEV